MQLPASLFLRPGLRSIIQAAKRALWQGGKFFYVLSPVGGIIYLNLLKASWQASYGKPKRQGSAERNSLPADHPYTISALDVCYVLEEDKGCQNKERDKDADRPDHVAEEAGHGNAAFLSNGTHHEVGGIAYVAVCAHKHGTG